MSAGGRVFVVILVLAFVATGLYYLFVTDGGELESAQAPSVSEPPEAVPTVLPAAEPEVVVEAEPTPTPIATNTLALRIAVPASNPAGVGLPRLRQRLRDSGPDGAGNGIAGWFEVYDPESFAEDDQMREALRQDPAEYFKSRFGLVVEPHGEVLQMMLYTLPSRSVAPSSSRGVDVLAVEPMVDGDGRPGLRIDLDEATGRRVALLTEPNISRPCAILVNDKVVVVPRLMSKLSNLLAISGDFDEAEVGLIENGIKGEDTLVALRIPQPVATEVAVIEPAPQTSTDELLLANTTTVPRANPTPAAKPDEPTTTPTSPRVVTTKTTDYVVKEGDTLSSISEMWFGETNAWTLIAQANPSMDPNQLSVGQVLKLPPKNVATVAPDPKSKEYTVRSGDSLATISRAIYGSDQHWKALYEANRNVIGDDPSDLAVGMRLKIPQLK